jgi:hypothetical protein
MTSRSRGQRRNVAPTVCGVHDPESIVYCCTDLRVTGLNRTAVRLQNYVAAVTARQFVGAVAGARLGCSHKGQRWYRPTDDSHQLADEELRRWRRESNPCARLCRPLPHHSATPPRGLLRLHPSSG